MRELNYMGQRSRSTPWTERNKGIRTNPQTSNYRKKKKKKKENICLTSLIRSLLISGRSTIKVGSLFTPVKLSQRMVLISDHLFRTFKSDHLVKGHLLSP